MPDLLRVDELVSGYGSAPVLHGLSLGVGAGEIAVLLGANGVGKTTTLRTVSGLVRAWSGRISFDGRSIERAHPEDIVRAGVGMVPEPPGVFRDMPVLENLRVGGFALGRGRRDVERRVEEVLAAFPFLRERLHQTGGSLSGGEQRQLAIARALVGRPRLLLVDEASMGLAPVMVATVFRLLSGVRDDGVTVCMVEQNAAALDVADRAYVMEQGRVVHEASGAAMHRTRAELTRAYLGGAAS